MFIINRENKAVSVYPAFKLVINYKLMQTGERRVESVDLLLHMRLTHVETNVLLWKKVEQTRTQNSLGR